MPKTSRAKTPYNFFFSIKRKEIIEKNPDMKSKDVMKEVGKLWKELSETEKEKYKKMSEEDHARVDEEKKSSPAENKSKAKKKKEEEDEEEGEE